MDNMRFLVDKKNGCTGWSSSEEELESDSDDEEELLSVELDGPAVGGLAFR